MAALSISPRARRQITAAARWWKSNRDKAPEAFDEDLTSAGRDIASTPFLGVPVRSRRPGLRRVLLPRIRYYLYYRVVSDDVIEIAALWHASRRPPQL